jgi:hypothetical protein
LCDRRAPRGRIRFGPDGARYGEGSVGHLLLDPWSPSAVVCAWNEDILAGDQAPVYRVRPRAASLDVMGVLVAIGALGAGARDRTFVVFGCVSLLGTIALGTVLSLIVGPRIAGIDWGVLLPHDPTEDRVAAPIGIVLGLALLAWGIVRPRRLATRPPKPSASRGLGLIFLAGVETLFALAAVVDTTLSRSW